MASSSSLGARGHVNHRLLTEIVQIFQTMKFGEAFKIFSLSTKQFLRWARKAGTASSQYVVDVLRTKIQSREANSFASIFATTDPPLL